MHVDSNFNLKMVKDAINVGVETGKTVSTTSRRGWLKSASSCFEMDELILKRGVVKLRHPTHFPWLQPEMLAHGNMAKLISEKQFTMMFCIFFAYDEFFFDKRVFLINACFDCFSFLYMVVR